MSEASVWKHSFYERAMCSMWGEEFARDTEKNGHLLCSVSVVAVARLE